MSRVVLVRDVEIYGKPYKQGQDVSEVDQGTIQSLLGVGWAKAVQDEAPVESVIEKTSKKKKS